MIKTAYNQNLNRWALGARGGEFFFIINLDQTCTGFSDGRASFPPKSVQLKRIFSIKPWSDSDENVGNLLMVRFFSHFFFWIFLLVDEIC